VISYAQNAEDVVLARLFAGRDTGRYVDVGAADPVRDSVTKHFYDLGWRGINIEPIPAQAADLRRARPEDVTLPIALGARAGTATLHLVANRPGWSTVDDALARTYTDRDDLRVEQVEVQQRTLADVLAEYDGPVDFLKIDVEGAERLVIEGADWTRCRPRVVVVEATEPGSPTPAYRDWEPLLVAAGYRCALFDGLNRFYADADDTEARATLAVPANVFDDYERFDVTEQREALGQARVRHAAEVAYIRRLEDAVREAQEGRAKDAELLAESHTALRDAQRGAARTGRHLAAVENRVAELETGQAAAAAHITMLERRLAALRTPDE
jgi:FkbM family methyltransferase